MLFNSITFAIFIPIVFLLYYALPHKYRWVFLLLASYVFYMNLHVGYGLLLFLSTILTYTLALRLEQAGSDMSKVIKTTVFLADMDDKAMFALGNPAVSSDPPIL